MNECERDIGIQGFYIVPRIEIIRMDGEIYITGGSRSCPVCKQMKKKDERMRMGDITELQ